MTLSKYNVSTEERITVTFSEVPSAFFPLIIYGLDVSMDSTEAAFSYIYLVHSVSPSPNTGIINITKCSLGILKILSGYQVKIENCTIRELEARNSRTVTSTAHKGNVKIVNSELKLLTVNNGYQAHVENCTLYDLEAKNSSLYLISPIFNQMDAVNSTVGIHDHVRHNTGIWIRIRVINASQLLISNSTFRGSWIQAERSDVVMHNSKFSVLYSSGLLQMNSGVGNSLRVENCIFNSNLSVHLEEIEECILCINNITEVAFENSSFIVGRGSRSPKEIIKFSSGSLITVIDCLFQAKGTHILFSGGYFFSFH